MKICNNCVHENDKDHDEKGSAYALCFDGSNFEEIGEEKIKKKD